MSFHISRLAIRQRIMPRLNSVPAMVFRRAFTEGRLIPSEEEEGALPGKEKNGNQPTWEQWYERLDTKVEAKNDKLDAKIEQKFTQLLSLNAETNTKLNQVSVDVASLRVMTAILYSIIISGIIGGGGALLVYSI